MTHLTDEELDALESELWASDAASSMTNRAARAITALRAQISEARAIIEEQRAAIAIAESYAHRADAELAAIDRVKAEVRVAAIREAADKLKGQGYNTAVRQILALLDKDGA